MEKEFGTEIWTLLAKYLTHEATDGERAEAEQILRQYPHLIDDFQKLSVAYYLNSPAEDVDTATLFEQLNKRINRT